MAGEGVDAKLVRGWLAARSLARGLPAPVDDHGGFRVDTGSQAEAVRWVFPRMGPGIAALVATIREPRHFVKLCGGVEQLHAVLPASWTVQAGGHFMRANGAPPARGVPAGYRLKIDTVTGNGGRVHHAQIFCAAGTLAASGYAAEAGGVFVYDRIVTEPDHRRKGLGHVLMQTLHAARRDANASELLVATDAGRALYATLGWAVLSPYVTGVREGEG